jgi:hypothetical protein
MFSDKKSVLLAALKTLNEFRPADQQVPVDGATLLIGKGAVLESLDLVNLLLSAEEAMVAKGIEPPNLIELAMARGDGSASLTVSELAQRIDAALSNST